MSEFKFRKCFARFYLHWFADCHDSAIYCIKSGNKDRARQYLDDASKYLTIIMENWDAIEFFSKGENAILIDSALPKEFRGYL